MIHPTIVAWADSHPGTVLLETTRHDNLNHRSYIFQSPSRIVTCSRLSEIEGSLDSLQEAVREGQYVAGYLAYEAGYAFESRLNVPDDFATPLVWFGIYSNPIIFNHFTGNVERNSGRLLEIMAAGELPTEPSHLPIPSATLSESEYEEGFERIQSYLREGDTYQVNFTFKLKFPLVGSAASLYCTLRRQQRVNYSAFLKSDKQSILSFSPELFFRIDGTTITLKPMKGTAPRGRTTVEDMQREQALRQSDKEKSENLMIVDMLRNDAGRLAAPGTVRVERFFNVEKYETVLQATSTITAQLRESFTLSRMMRSLFPCGSVTGAPKIRTMQIIRETEKKPRNVYTGSIGFVAPDNKAVFNVAIRTLTVDSGRQAEMGVGSGVVVDSTADREYQECLLKGRFLTQETPPFELLETIRRDRSDGWFLVRYHEKRLRSSAEYFDFPYDEVKWKHVLGQIERKIAADFPDESAVRIRMTLDRSGNFAWRIEPLQPLTGTPRVCYSRRLVNSRDRFLFHKTTHRAVYDSELSEARHRGYFDVLFENERGEITEGARSNIVIQRGDRYVTPPTASGVLAGTCRAYLLEEQPLRILEELVHREDIDRADRVFLCNALYGMVEVKIDDPEEVAENIETERTEKKGIN
jgi:para-aminobenzoate synthetase/4-amino-4-deoxychorismate lyase